MNLQDHVSSSSTTTTSSRSNGTSKQKRKTIYPVHWSEERLKREVSSKKAFRGTYRQNQYNRNEGRVTVHVSNEERTYVLRGQSSINRAIDGDIVVVVIEDEKKSDDDITARVVGILKRNWRNYCGTLLEDDMVGGTFVFYSLSCTRSLYLYSTSNTITHRNTSCIRTERSKNTTYSFHNTSTSLVGEQMDRGED